MRKRRKKRCPYCHELFWPDPRTAKRQRSCSRSECQKLRRQETQRRYRAKNIGDHQAKRYRETISEAKAGKSPQITSIRIKKHKIFKYSLWDEIQDEISPDLYISMAYITELILKTVKDEILRQPDENKGKIVQQIRDIKKDEILRQAGENRGEIEQQQDGHSRDEIVPMR